MKFSICFSPSTVEEYSIFASVMMAHSTGSISLGENK